MSDSLRDRIADAIFAAIPVTNEQAQRAAGTVINHLGLTKSATSPNGQQMSERYVQVMADSDVFMCRDCPVGNRYLMNHQTETHDRWHDRQDRLSD